MITKTFEIRDRGTFIPVLAVKLTPSCTADGYLLARAGYHSPSEYIFLAKIDGGDGRATSDPYEWSGGARTMPVAHEHIIKNWEHLPSGAVVDIEFILGESDTSKMSEALG